MMTKIIILRRKGESDGCRKDVTESDIVTDLGCREDVT